MLGISVHERLFTRPSSRLREGGARDLKRLQHTGRWQDDPELPERPEGRERHEYLGDVWVNCVNRSYDL